MIIDKIDLYLVKNKFYHPWRTAYGSDPGNAVLIVRMASGKFEGWSESSPLPGPNYCYEYGEGAFNIAKNFLAPAILGKDIESARQINEFMAEYKGNPFAKGGIEMAWWPLKAEADGVPLWKTLGAKPGKIQVGDGWGIYDDFDTLIEKIGSSFDDGYTRVKLKMCHGWDYDMLQAVRSVFPTQTIHVDANSSYRFNDPDDLALLRSLDKFNLAMIEQPFQTGDLYHTAKLQAMMDTPLCLDEGVTDVWQAEEAVEMGACRYINIKPARVGGLQNTIDIANICQQAGVGCWIGGMMESDIGKSMCVAAAALPNMVYSHDVTPSTINYPELFTDETLVMDKDCCLATSDRPGNPVKPVMKKMMKKVALEAQLGLE